MSSRAPRFLLVLASLVGLAAAGLTVASCKQAEGEQCQVNADCEDGLICRQVGRVCASSADDPTFDAGPDAEVIDADVIPDAAPTPPDAAPTPPDAAPTPPDAAP